MSKTASFARYFGASLALYGFVLAACSSDSDTGAVRANHDAGAVVDSGGEGAADGSDNDVLTPPHPCNDAESSPTASYELAAWPVLAPVSAADLGAGTGATPLPGAPAGVVATDDGYVFVALGNSEIAALKNTGSALQSLGSLAMPANETPFGLALSRDGTTLAVSLSDQVGIIDVAKLESGAPDALVATIPTQSAKGVGIDVAFSADAHFAFAALEYDHAVAVVDVTKQAYVGAIPIAGNAVTGAVVSPDGTRLYVTCEVADEFLAANPTPAADQIVGRVTVVDVTTAETNPTGSVLGQVYVGRAPVRARVSPDGATLWVTARGSNALVALDTASIVSGGCAAFVSSTAVGAAPVGLAVSADGKRVLVANSNRFAAPNAPQTVSVVDAAQAASSAAGAVIGQFTVGAFPREVAIQGSHAFVSNYNSHSLSALDLAL